MEGLLSVKSKVLSHGPVTGGGLNRDYCLWNAGVREVTSCDSVAAPVTNQPVTPKALTAGQNRPHPPHIPSHFPEFPDPHTYIKTPVSGGAAQGL